MRVDSVYFHIEMSWPNLFNLKEAQPILFQVQA